MALKQQALVSAVCKIRQQADLTNMCKTYLYTAIFICLNSIYLKQQLYNEYNQVEIINHSYARSFCHSNICPALGQSYE